MYTMYVVCAICVIKSIYNVILLSRSTRRASSDKMDDLSLAAHGDLNYVAE